MRQTRGSVADVRGEKTGIFTRVHDAAPIPRLGLAPPGEAWIDPDVLVDHARPLDFRHEKYARARPVRPEFRRLPARSSGEGS